MRYNSTRYCISVHGGYISGGSGGKRVGIEAESNYFEDVWPHIGSRCRTIIHRPILKENHL